MSGLEHFLTLFPDPYLLVDPDGSIRARSATANRVVDPGRTSLLDPPADADAVRNYLERCARTGSPIPGALRLDPDDSPLRCRGKAMIREGKLWGILLRLDPTADSSTGRFITLTETVDKLSAEAAERQRAQSALERNIRDAEFLARASADLARSLIPAEVVRATLDAAVAELGSAAVLRVAGLDLYELRSSVDLSPEAEAALRRLASLPNGAGSGDDAESAAPAGDERETLTAAGFHWPSVVLLGSASSPIGTLTLIRSVDDPDFDGSDRALIADFGQRVAAALQNATLYSSLEEARNRIEQQAIELEDQAARLEEQATELTAQVEHARGLNEALLEANEGLEAAHREAEAARQRAEKASAAKTDFLNVMSHELRTPMNAIIGYAELLGEGIVGPVTEAQREQIQRLQRAATHLLGLINQVLNLARIEAGREGVDAAPFALGPLIREVIGLVEPLASRRGLQISFDSESGDQEITTDKLKLRQILINLLNNAIKFTEQGGVRLRASVEAETFRIEVEDDGIGIAPEDVERIFGVFEQGGRELNNPVEGTGLGLAVSLHLAELLGGTLRLQRTSSAGSVFALELPRVIEATSMVADPERPAIRSLHDSRADSDRPDPIH